MKTTQQKQSRRSPLGILIGLILIVTGGLSYSATIVTFGEVSAPVSNIITSYVPNAGTEGGNAWFNDGLPANNGIRFVSQSFITPGSSDFGLTAITMQLNATLATSFPSSTGVSIDFYSLSGPGVNPIGTYTGTSWGANIQPTTSNATAGSYFTFTSDTALNLTAGGSYAYVLAFDSEDPSHLLRLTISQGDPDPAGTRAWQNTNGGGWANTSETYEYYMQGAAIPEPSVLGLLGVTAMGGFLLRRKVRQIAA